MEGRVVEMDVLNNLDGIVHLYEQIRSLKKCESPGQLTQSVWRNLQEATRLPLPEEVTGAVQKLFTLRDLSAEVQKRASAVQTRERKVFENQERIRTNIKSMEKVQSSGDLLKRYMQDFERDEDELKTMRSELEASEEERTKHESEIKQQEISIASIAKKHREKLEATS